jgi:hypothetical protein
VIGIRKLAARLIIIALVAAENGNYHTARPAESPLYVIKGRISADLV